jgi:hypothetical protein
MCPLKELFLVVVTINPARAKREMARISRAIRTSTREKPFDLIDNFIAKPLISGIFLAFTKSQTDTPEKANSVP